MRAKINGLRSNPDANEVLQVMGPGVGGGERPEAAKNKKPLKLWPGHGPISLAQQNVA